MDSQKQGSGIQQESLPNQTIIVVAQNRKSTGVAFILSFLFGPLGLLYASIAGGLIMLLISIPVAIFTLGFGLILTNVICVVWAIIAVNNHNSKASNPQQYQNPTPQRISETKIDPDPIQLKQPNQISSIQQSTFNIEEWFQKNKKMVFIGAVGVIGLLILSVAIKFVISLDFEKSKPATETANTAQPSSQENIVVNPKSEASGKYQQASERILKSSDIVNLNKYELKIMRNEIYARHGYRFNTADMKSYFELQSWYIPRFDDVTAFLTETEKRNIELIKRHE
jgi:flagellar basal body-associated protein FliL